MLAASVSDTLYLVGLLVTIVVAIFASMTAPLLLQRSSDKRHAEDRAEDKKEREEVRKSTQEVALRVAETAAQAESAAALLVTSNAAVATSTATQMSKLDELSGQVGVVHTLVNNNMTIALEARLASARHTLAALNENIRLQNLLGNQPTEEILAEIVSVETEINELSVQLGERKSAQAKADVMIKAEPSSGKQG